MKPLLIAVLLMIPLVFMMNSETQENINKQLPNNIVQTENQLPNHVSSKEPITEEIQPTLDGKTIALIGDSLMEGYGNDYHGFDYYLMSDLPNTKFINNSKSGSTITDNSGIDNIIMLNQAKTLTGNPDIIVLDGGANDIIGYSLGFLNQDLKKEIGNVNLSAQTISNEETVISDLEEVILELKNRFPNAKLCYLQPFLLDEETISHLTRRRSSQTRNCFKT